jgi:hypothetical protein
MSATTDRPEPGAAAQSAKPTSAVAIALWGLFSVALAGAGVWLVFGNPVVRVWYCDYKFTRAGDAPRREYWARRMGGLRSEAAVSRLLEHALGDHEPRALAAALVLTTSDAPGADEARREMLSRWPPERAAAFEARLTARFADAGLGGLFAEAAAAELRKQLKPADDPAETSRNAPGGAAGFWDRAFAPRSPVRPAP